MHRNSGIIALLAALASSAVAAQPQSGRSANIDPKADEALRNMSQMLASAKRFSFTAYDMTDYVYENGQKVQLANHCQVSVRRPNGVRAEWKGDTNNRSIWYDGTTLTAVDKVENTYFQIGVPPTIDAMMDFIHANYQQTVPFADLILSDPHGMVVEDLRSGEHLGFHDVQGDPCHHLSFRHEAVDWQIWIAAGEHPFPRKLVVTHRDFPGQPQYVAFLSNWNLAADVPDSVFVATVPPEAKKVEPERQTGGATQEGGAHPGTRTPGE